MRRSFFDGVWNGVDWPATAMPPEFGYATGFMVGLILNVCSLYLCWHFLRELWDIMRFLFRRSGL